MQARLLYWLIFCTLSSSSWSSHESWVWFCLCKCLRQIKTYEMYTILYHMMTLKKCLDCRIFLSFFILPFHNFPIWKLILSPHAHIVITIHCFPICWNTSHTKHTFTSSQSATFSFLLQIIRFKASFFRHQNKTKHV